MEQRSEEWFDARLGRFTASRVHELMGIKGLNKTGDSYAFEKAIELIHGKSDEDLSTFDMRRGTELEPVAFDLFAQTMELDFIDVKKASFFPLGENAGASPDGLVGEEEILEIKCPRHNKFFEIVRGVEIDKTYYDQMQMQMLCTNSIKCYFVNFVIFNSKPLMHIQEVERDEERIELIQERIKEAVILRDEYVAYLLRNDLLIDFSEE